MSDLTPKLLNWYQKNKRDLPWRHTRNPYLVWLSEIILQQTRVDQGMPYYLAFAKKYPTVNHLANANEKEVLKLWQGLGYYSRARNLHEASKYITNELKGEFPNTYHEILKLKGVGQYTASAISSFVYGEANAVVDGNVFRVFSRYFGISTPIDSSRGKKEFYELANELIDKKDPGTFNQAIMEFGAMQCVPKNPNCTVCPLNNSCFAFSKKKVDKFPVKDKKTKVRNRYFNYLIIRHQSSVLLNHRKEKDIWKGLFDLPLIETNKPMKTEKLLTALEFKRIVGKNKFLVKRVSPVFKHVLSHQHIFARFTEVETKIPVKNNSYLSVKEKSINKYALPRLIDRYFRKEL